MDYLNFLEKKKSIFENINNHFTFWYVKKFYNIIG